MDDRVSANVVEVTVDDTGKLWVNVDGVCALRIGSCGEITMDDPLRGNEMVYARDA